MKSESSRVGTASLEVVVAFVADGEEIGQSIAAADAA